MKSLIYSLFLLLLILGCSQNKTKPITELSQNDINKGILVDVRTPEEFKAGHIDNALNINWHDDDFSDQISDIAKDETIYLYCRSGRRSGNAARMLDSLGYDNAINLTGGYEAYSKN